MSDGPIEVTVCVCTFRRAQYLPHLLHALGKQVTGGKFMHSIIVVDNDVAESARDVVRQLAAAGAVNVRYFVQPERNIAMTRNVAIAHAHGEFVAFIDDDEVPVDDWLLLLLNSCLGHGAAGVLGPVEPRFATPPARWILAGGFFERPKHPTGVAIGLSDARTGNALLRRSVVDGMAMPFDPRFANGGEDVDFFRRVLTAGHRLVWCNEAVVYETVPASRCTRRYLLRRALLRGQNNFRQREGRAGRLLASAVALPTYAVLLPVLLVAGHHHFMRFLIKFCDHLGRLGACFGFNLVASRDP
ncbi:MAG: glycosyltransferase family A protein [Steroidobacteraceae bacterium]